MPTDAVRLVLTNCPDGDVAETIAHTLVSERLAACVNILGPCRSVYEWKGRVCQEVEVPVLIKTTASRYAAVEARVRELHPYELPEVVAVDLAAGLPAYLDWVAGQTTAA